jgi:HlyD family secretion protein
LDVEFKASVISVDPAETIREGVATYKTVLAFDDVDTRIRSGMSANVDIITAVTEDVIVIPRGAVIFEEGDTYVVLKDKTRRAIEIRDTSSVGRVEVLRGLRSGDAILLTP